MRTISIFEYLLYSITINPTTFDITTLTSSLMVLIDLNESFPYIVNGTSATYYGERDTYTY